MVPPNLKVARGPCCPTTWSIFSKTYSAIYLGETLEEQKKGFVTSLLGHKYSFLSRFSINSLSQWFGKTKKTQNYDMTSPWRWYDKLSVL